LDSLLSRRHIPAADGLRGIAVLATMLFHAQYFAGVDGPAGWERAYLLVAGLGWAGVDLFFVLSGFLITGILYDSRIRPNYFRVFYLRRAVRIFPLYYGVLFLLFLVAPALLHVGHATSPASLFGSITTQLFAWLYLVNWDLAVQGFGAISPFIAHFWSLSVEEQFYLGWPAVVRMFSRERLLALCGVMVLVALLMRILLFRRGWSTAAYVLPFARMDGLATGAFIALAARSATHWALLTRWAPRVALVATAALAGVVLRTGTTSFGDPLVGTVGISLLCLVFGGALVRLVSSPVGGRTQQLVQSKPLRWFGKYSYCLYVINQPAMVLLAKLGLTVAGLQAVLHSRALALLGVDLASIALCALVAFASWHLFEKHWLALKRRPQLHHPEIIKEAVPI
jgi:peptidoglycan/LPS O-acetylase OafA/YrhL